MDSVRSVIEGKGWDNHEDTFEEALRRELLQARKENELLKDDLRQLTESYYKAIGKKHANKK